LKFYPKRVFDTAVAHHHGDKHAKGMTCWSQFVALLFCHLGGARSLREIIGGLAASEGKLRHLGIARAPTRSTLAYANEHRPWKIYQEAFEQLLSVCQSDARSLKRRFRFRYPLLSLDSTLISVCVSMFDWAAFSQTKGAVKLHLVLNHQGYLPQYAVISDGKTADVKVAQQMEFAPGTIVVMDRGYEDHRWWRTLTLGGVYFVTRLKDSTGYVILAERGVPAGAILRDEEIMLLSESKQSNPMRLRRIEVWVEEKQNTLVFVTNHPKLAASTISSIYKDRWQIELFFKAIKQSLRIKTFIGTSENAVHIQIWTALIAMLLVRYLQLRSSWNWSLSNLFALLRQQLFVYRDLWNWLNQPFHPPIETDSAQLMLGLT
jgi:hypothetical protein